MGCGCVCFLFILEVGEILVEGVGERVIFAMVSLVDFSVCGDWSKVKKCQN